jgi:MFS transporter, DHA1 family, multidrug resistance protein
MAWAAAGWRSRLRRADPVLLVVCLAVATTQTAWSIVVPVLPAYTAEFGANATELGLVVAMFGVGRLLVNVPAGILTTRFDARKLLVGSVLAVVACQAATAFAPSLAVLLALRFATGLAGGMAITCGMTLIADLTHTTNRGRAMSLLQGAQLIGGTLGPPLGGLVAVVWGYQAPFLVCGVLAMSVVVVGWRSLFGSRAGRRQVRSATPEGSGAGTTDAGTDGRGRIRQLLRDRSFLAVCAVAFSVFFHRFGGTQSLIPVIAYTVVGLSVGELGLLLGIVTACNLVMVTLAGSVSDRVGRKKVIVPGLATAALVLPLYAVGAHPAWFVAVTLVTGIAMGFSGPTPAAYMADVAPAGARGPAVGIYRTFGDLAGIVGPILLGWLVDGAGYRTAVFVLAGVMFGAVLIFATVARETVRPRARGTSTSAARGLSRTDR